VTSTRFFPSVKNSRFALGSKVFSSYRQAINKKASRKGSFFICDLDGSKIKPYFESLDGFESVGLVSLNHLENTFHY
jgi:hypothetical protein